MSRWKEKLRSKSQRCQSSKESRKQRTLRRNPLHSSHVPRHAARQRARRKLEPSTAGLGRAAASGKSAPRRAGDSGSSAFLGRRTIFVFARSQVKYGGFLCPRELVLRGRGLLVERKGPLTCEKRQSGALHMLIRGTTRTRCATMHQTPLLGVCCDWREGSAAAARRFGTSPRYVQRRVTGPEAAKAYCVTFHARWREYFRKYGNTRRTPWSCLRSTIFKRYCLR
jgi:hypothetical protein